MLLTLLTDFGSQSPYLAIIKGIALSRLPALTIVDVCNQVEPADIRTGQFFLTYCHPEFPAGTVHLAVIDPGVGTDRLPLAIRTRDGSFYIGPDNGLLTSQINNAEHLCQISNPEIIADRPAATFHGRDIFLPAALHLLAGNPLADLGPAVEPAALVQDPLPRPHHQDNRIIGKIIYIDPFGNLITNIARDLLPEGRPFRCQFRGWLTDTLTTTYGQAPPRATILTCSSFGLLEIAINRGSAAKRFAFDRHQLATSEVIITLDD
ncbi:MAG: SAM-dependent chlorinase/fluorinase [Deltaproteobacteria bacterium]|nr:SAM-dependent chlorinase/fluorinase [Deltaproteobacteria bacterium]